MEKDLRNIFIFGFLFLVLDQIIKIVISSKLVVGQSIELITNFFSITLAHNTGAAFSILEGNRILFILIGIVAIVLIGVYAKKMDEKTDLDIFIFALLIGGILGNIVDRVVYGYVIDFLSFNIFGYAFPIFNLADSFIVIAIIILIAKIIKEDLWS